MLTRLDLPLQFLLRFLHGFNAFLGGGGFKKRNKLLSALLTVTGNVGHSSFQSLGHIKLV